MSEESPTTMFDARSRQDAPPQDPDPYLRAEQQRAEQQLAQAQHGQTAAVLGGGTSTLDALRAASEEVVEFEPYVFENPKRTIRFTCDPNFEGNRITRWQNAALPPQARGKRGTPPDLSKLVPTTYFALMVTDTCTMVEVRNRQTGEYDPVVDNASGDLLTFNDHALLMAFGSPDKVMALKNAMNGADWAIQREGKELLDKSGFGDGEVDEDSPLD